MLNRIDFILIRKGYHYINCREAQVIFSGLCFNNYILYKVYVQQVLINRKVMRYF